MAHRVHARFLDIEGSDPRRCVDTSEFEEVLSKIDVPSEELV